MHTVSHRPGTARGHPTCTATQLSLSEQPSATTLSTHRPDCTCDSAGPHPVHQSREKGPRHFERSHSARVKVQSLLEEVNRVEATHTHHSSYKRTPHSCPPHSLTHTSTRTHSNPKPTTLRECTSSLSHATACCEDCSQHHTHSARVNAQHMVEEWSHAVLTLITEY